MMTCVVALGGNAIQTGNVSTAEAQQMAIRRTVQQLMPLVLKDWRVVVTHGNGPQVGHLMLREQAAESEQSPAMPLSVCGAMTEGMIGGWIQLEFTRAFRELGLSKTAASVVTLTEVDAEDPAFKNPTKPVGPFYTEEEAAQVLAEHPDFVLREDAGRGIRRVVASPRPQGIIEIEAIRELVQSGVLTIAVGGGGIPVSSGAGGLCYRDAVIDKDLSTAKLAELLEADELIILTGVDYVYVDFGKPQQRRLENVTLDEMQAYMAQEQFAPGSMLPKIEACCEFLKNRPKGRAVISSLDKLSEVIVGRAGTCIHAGHAHHSTNLDKQKLRQPAYV
jgi:carbamate kinase